MSNKYLSARDKRLKERERQRREKKAWEKRQVADEYIRNVHMDGAARKVPSSTTTPSYGGDGMVDLDGAFGKAAVDPLLLPQREDRDARMADMDEILRDKERKKNLRESVYEEKRRRHMARAKQGRAQEEENGATVANMGIPVDEVFRERLRRPEQPEGRAFNAAEDETLGARRTDGLRSANLTDEIFRDRQAIPRQEEDTIARKSPVVSPSGRNADIDGRKIRREARQEYARQLEEQMKERGQNISTPHPPNQPDKLRPPANIDRASFQEMERANKKMKQMEYNRQLREQMNADMVRRDVERGRSRSRSPERLQRGRASTSPIAQDGNISEKTERANKKMKQMEYNRQLKEQMLEKKSTLRNIHATNFEQTQEADYLKSDQGTSAQPEIDDGFGSNMTKKDAATRQQIYAQQLREQMAEKNTDKYAQDNGARKPRSTWGEDAWEEKRRVKVLDPKSYGEELRMQIQHKRLEVSIELIGICHGRKIPCHRSEYFSYLGAHS